MSANKSDKTINRLTKHIENLNKAFDELLSVMGLQIDAIIRSDTDMVEMLTEKHSAISSDFKKCEKVFTEELQATLNENEIERVKLSGLKKLYPESTSLIDLWRELLMRNSSRLQNKHEQIVHLLEFAMVRNADLMRAIYSENNQKTAHYNPAGNKDNLVTGMAVNQEA